MADDSEVKETPATPKEEKPTGPISMIVRKPGGGVREMLKDPITGKIVAKPKRMVSTLEVTRLTRNYLDMRVADTKAGTNKFKKRLEMLNDHMYKIAVGESEADAKKDMASVQAYKEITLRAYGKPSVSDEDRGALERAGIKIVVIPAPQLMHPEVVKEHQENEKPVKPSFINAEFIDAEIISNEPENKE